MKIMSQIVDKDRPCTPLCLLSPNPASLSRFLNAVRMKNAEKVDRGEGDGKEEGSKTGTAGLGSSGRLERNRRALKAIYRP